MSDLFGSWVAGGNPKNGRVDDDFYATPPECVDALLENVELPNKIWEPCCGDGAISKVLEGNGYDVISTDLNNYGFGEPFTDFLKQNKKRADCVVTNPPFKISQDIIEKCFEMDVSTVALLLKTQYWHAKKRTDLFEKYIPSKILAMNWRPDFSGGGSPTMDCIWTVWEKGKTQCVYKPIRKVSK